MIGNCVKCFHTFQFTRETKNFGIFLSCSDSLLATLLDAVRSCGNQNVHVRLSRTPRGKRVVPLSASVDEETEANLLRMVIHNFQYSVKRFEILERFNANIPHSGLNYSVTQDVSFKCVNSFVRKQIKQIFPFHFVA